MNSRRQLTQRAERICSSAVRAWRTTPQAWSMSPAARWALARTRETKKSLRAKFPSAGEGGCGVLDGVGRAAQVAQAVAELGGELRFVEVLEPLRVVLWIGALECPRGLRKGVAAGLGVVQAGEGAGFHRVEVGGQGGGGDAAGAVLGGARWRSGTSAADLGRPRILARRNAATCLRRRQRLVNCTTRTVAQLTDSSQVLRVACHTRRGMRCWPACRASLPCRKSERVFTNTAGIH